MNIYPSFLKINLLFLLLVFSIVLVSYWGKYSIPILFLPPATPRHPSAGLFTHAFQILCCLPPFICAFTFAFLRLIKSAQKNQDFLFVSALVTGGFMANEIFRFHIILLFYDIPKPVTISVFAIIVLIYLLSYYQKIKTTPYKILLSSLGLLLLAIIIDFLQLQNYYLATLLEGIPKLLSVINLGLYFWFVCLGELLKTYKST
jgi:hypothetical protein